MDTNKDIMKIDHFQNDIQLIELMLDKAHIDYINELIDTEEDPGVLAHLIAYKEKKKMEFNRKLKAYQTQR